jgi:hypothetical protein
MVRSWTTINMPLPKELKTSHPDCSRNSSQNRCKEQTKRSQAGGARSNTHGSYEAILSTRDSIWHKDTIPKL